MTASFFWTNGTQGKDPLDTITLLDDKQAKHYLREHFAFPPESFALPRGNALLMGGITDDLRRALQSDIGQGLKEIRVEGLMAIWYVRCKHRFKDITVVSIASLQGYWDLKLNDPDKSSGYRWMRLFQGHTVNGGVTLDVLANDLLLKAKGVPSWELDR